MWKFLTTTAAALVLATTPLAAAQTEQDGTAKAVAFTIIYIAHCDRNAVPPTVRRFAENYAEQHKTDVVNAGAGFLQQMDAIERAGNLTAWGGWCAHMKPLMDLDPLS